MRIKCTIMLGRRTTGCVAFEWMNKGTFEWINWEGVAYFKCKEIFKSAKSEIPIVVTCCVILSNSWNPFATALKPQSMLELQNRYMFMFFFFFLIFLQRFIHSYSQVVSIKMVMMIMSLNDFFSLLIFFYFYSIN